MKTPGPVKTLGPATVCRTLAALVCLSGADIAAAAPLIRLQLEPESTQHILFPKPIRLGLAAGSPLTAEVLEEHLWLTSPRSLPQTQRLLVQSADGDRRWILEVSTAKAAAGQRQSRPAMRAADTVYIEPAGGRPKEMHRHLVTLARWVYQQLYSPMRLLQPLPGVIRYPLSSAALNLIRCSATDKPRCPLIHSTSLAAWRYIHKDTGTFYICAVQLTNTEPVPVTLSPARLRGDWLAVSFSALRLTAAGQRQDSSVVLLVSRQSPATTLSI